MVPTAYPVASLTSSITSSGWGRIPLILIFDSSLNLSITSWCRLIVVRLTGLYQVDSCEVWFSSATDDMKG